MLKHYNINIRKQWNLALAVSWFVLVVSASTYFTGSVNVFERNTTYSSVNVTEGDTHTFTCNITEGPGVYVYWSYGISPDVFQNGTRLQLIDISRTESGNYVCYITNTSDPYEYAIVTVVDINVQYPAEITAFSLTPNPVTENESYRITCHWDGNPDPSWEIRHNATHTGIVRSPDAGGITISASAACSDSGITECIVMNSLNVDNKPSRQQTLLVMCAPRSGISSLPRAATGQLGSDVSFEDFAYGYPMTTFTWSRDADKLNVNATVDRTIPVSYTKMTLSNIQISDYGNYSLVVNNSLGSYTTYFLLRPPYSQAPEGPTDFESVVLKNTSVRLWWTSGFDMWGNMSFIIMRHASVGYWYQLKSIYPHAAYKNHGVGQRWHYDLTDLDPGVYYLKMIAITSTSSDYSEDSDVITFNITGPVTPSPIPWPSDNFPHRQSPWLIVAYCGIAVAVAACLLVSAIVLVRRYMGYNEEDGVQFTNKRPQLD